MTNQPGIYQHYKGGLYEVIETVFMDGTREPMVIYRPLYLIPQQKFGQKTVRTEVSFNAMVRSELPDGSLSERYVPRFEKVDNSPWGKD